MGKVQRTSWGYRLFLMLMLLILLVGVGLLVYGSMTNHLLFVPGVGMLGRAVPHV